MYGILHGQCTILVEFPLPYSCSRYICLCEAIPYSSHQFSVNFMHHCFACCGVTMGEYGRGCSATTVHSSYTARAAVDLQCTLHYIACTLHLGLGMESQLSKSTLRRHFWWNGGTGAKLSIPPVKNCRSLKSYTLSVLVHLSHFTSDTHSLGWPPERDVQFILP